MLASTIVLILRNAKLGHMNGLHMQSQQCNTQPAKVRVRRGEKSSTLTEMEVILSREREREREREEERKTSR